MVHVNVAALDIYTAVQGVGELAVDCCQLAISYPQARSLTVVNRHVH